ncbi:glycoside hydrolase family 5 protein [Roseibium sp. RKSG952]|uniref:glycoside hydrolase family 5 protein n=1 Tax=Roseibium sp. RKSG952 TaxID=2529384 RepID=UPI001AD92CEB|nr:glycoside hydrolase family 5 protein [Roseibium sp. RKSG952]
MTTVSPVQAETCLYGANVSGGEFGKAEDKPGTYGVTHQFPSAATYEYLASKGMNAVRLPFQWERIQPELFGPFEPEELGHLTKSIAEARANGLTVILNPHNYGKYYGRAIGSRDVPVDALADFWGRLASLYPGKTDIVFGLMNEPVDLTARTWLDASNRAIRAIRDTGADNLVLVPGTIWTGSSHWFDQQDGGSNAEVMLAVTDPAENFAIEVHQYLDADFSGTGTSCSRTADALAALKRFSGWLETFGYKGFLGEFGGSQNRSCLDGVKEIATFINRRPDIWIGWTIWAAGEWWGAYPYSIQPEDGIDRPQMATLIPFLESDHSSRRDCQYPER